MSSTPIVRPEVARFVADVRGALADLGAEELDELTGGLEADLSDAVDVGGLAALGDPAAYAAELRAAAGLPPQTSQDARLRAYERARHAAERVRSHPWWPPVRDFAVSLRPAWWVLRGWLLYLGVGAPLIGGDATAEAMPSSPPRLLLLLAFVLASVQLGRRERPLRARWRAAVIAVNIVAVGLLPTGWMRVQPAQSATGAYPTVTGLAYDGDAVTNVFAYDDEGRLLPGVQLFDQDGRPLDADPMIRSNISTTGQGVTHYVAPIVNADGRTVWNVFPLLDQRGTDVDGDGVFEPQGAPRTPPPPFRSVAPVIEPSPSGTPSPSPSVTP